MALIASVPVLLGYVSVGMAFGLLTVKSGFHPGLAELIGVGTVIGLHLWKRNNLLSIVGGTFVYMVMVQYVF